MHGPCLHKRMPPHAPASDHADPGPNSAKNAKGRQAAGRRDSHPCLGLDCKLGGSTGATSVHQPSPTINHQLPRCYRFSNQPLNPCNGHECRTCGCPGPGLHTLDAAPPPQAHALARSVQLWYCALRSGAPRRRQRLGLRKPQSVGQTGPVVGRPDQ